MLAVAYLALGWAVVAGEPDDDYVRLYRQLQQADELFESGRADEARKEFLAARDALVQVTRTLALSRELAVSRQDTAVRETENRRLRTELGEVQRQLTVARAAPVPSTSPAPDVERLRTIEQERDELRLKLDGVLRKLLEGQRSVKPGAS
jgi:hypothetical protein